MNIKNKKLIFFFIFCVLISTINAEFKICATDKNSAECKKIEASRNDVKCVPVTDSVDCIFKIQKGEVDFGTFTPEEALLATNFLEGKADVIAEVRNSDRLDHEFAFQTVVVVKANYTGGLGALMNSAYCHPGFSRSQYWTDQVLKYFERKVLEFQPRALQCTEDKSAHENELYRLTQIFRKSCRPGPWSVNDWWDKRLKKSYSSLCSQCYHPPSCAYAIQNKGDHHAALRCLTDGNGDVAYTALEFVQEYFNLGMETYQSPHNASGYRFLCEDGTMKELTTRDVCAWVKQPWTAVVAQKNVSANISSHLKTWLPQDSSKLESWAVNLQNLVTKDRGEIRYLSISASLTDYVKRGRNIPQFETSPCRRTIRWCTINDKEQQKCEILKTAAKTHGIPTELQCVRGTDKIVCLNKIKENKADIVFIDSDLGFTARKVYNLTTATFLETERTGDYYGVIVVKKGTYSQFKDLKNKRACFPKYNGLGWLSYAYTVKNQSLVPNKLCSDSRMVWDFFSEACAPGASDPNINDVPTMVPDKLCARCTAVQHNGCKAESRNPYYGEVGALRCLNNKDGDVAFLNFYAIKKFLNSDRHNTDDANIKLEDFSILCRDGSIADFNITDPEKCSVTQINGGEVVMRKSVTPAQKRDISETLLELDDWFGTTSRRYDPVLRMYEPFDGDNDVLFKESSVALVSAYETQNRFVNNYVQLLNTMENCYKESKASDLISSAFMVLLSVLIILFDNN